MHFKENLLTEYISNASFSWPNLNILFVSGQNDHVESSEESAKKVKLFFAHAVKHWNSEFFVKVNDDIYVNIGKSSFC